MPHPCVVCGRSRMNPNNKEEEYMFFGFPVNDEARCKKWLDFCCREDLYKLTKKQLLQRMVCSKHFVQKNFLNEYLDKLKCSAVPSVYDPKQSLYNITCVLCGRFRQDPPDANYDGTTFHHFPGEEFRCLKWLDFVGVDSYYRLTRKEILFCYICSNHFDRSQFMPGYKNRLKDTAVPNIRNPGQLNTSELFTSHAIPEEKFHELPEKPKKLEPLPTAVLESQACAACGRSRSDPRNKTERYKFHPFPAYEIGRCLRWCQFLGREDLLKMSPNQIRKLVLCSKHFETGQNFLKIGPCDAVPTIKDVEADSYMEPVKEAEFENDIVKDINCSDVIKGQKKQMFSRPLVSSKKPKVDNKPAPLAKKRGKSKRPTSINIPRIDPNRLENRIVKKLPLPPTSSWKIQFPDQCQPITITNNITSTITDAIPTNVKKVILPFSGDISNLGAPIPVNSLSSIPPGLLIKINLPEQEQQKLTNSTKKQTKNRDLLSTASSKETQTMHHVKLKNDQVHNAPPATQEVKNPTDKALAELLSISSDAGVRRINSNDLEIQEEIVLPSSMEILDGEAVQVKEEQYFSEYETADRFSSKERRIIRRRKVTGTMRRTMFPIKSEVRCFLRKLAPQMHRLPRKARAQLKLSIVNMVIDHL